MLKVAERLLKSESIKTKLLKLAGKGSKMDI